MDNKKKNLFNSAANVPVPSIYLRNIIVLSFRSKVGHFHTITL